MQLIDLYNGYAGGIGVFGNIDFSFRKDKEWNTDILAELV